MRLRHLAWNIYASAKLFLLMQKGLAKCVYAISPEERRYTSGNIRITVRTAIPCYRLPAAAIALLSAPATLRMRRSAFALGLTILIATGGFLWFNTGVFAALFNASGLLG